MINSIVKIWSAKRTANAAGKPPGPPSPGKNRIEEKINPKKMISLRLLAIF